MAMGDADIRRIEPHRLRKRPQCLLMLVNRTLEQALPLPQPRGRVFLESALQQRQRAIFLTLVDRDLCKLFQRGGFERP